MGEAAAKVRDKRSKPRFQIQAQVHIKAQLIGTAMRFPFITENLSESGLLVNHESNLRHAFNNHSILEVWVQDKDDDEIYFFAKYVRKASDSSFAIRIIDIDATNARKYQAFITRHREIEASGAEDDPELDGP